MLVFNELAAFENIVRSWLCAFKADLHLCLVSTVFVQVINAKINSAILTIQSNRSVKRLQTRQNIFWYRLHKGSRIFLLRVFRKTPAKFSWNLTFSGKQQHYIAHYFIFLVLDYLSTRWFTTIVNFSSIFYSKFTSNVVDRITIKL